MRCDTDLPLKRCKDLRGSFSPDKAEDAGGLTPTKDDNAVWRKTGRKNCIGFMEVQYEIHGRDKKQKKRPPHREAASFVCCVIVLLCLMPKRR